MNSEEIKPYLESYFHTSTYKKHCARHQSFSCKFVCVCVNAELIYCGQVLICAGSLKDIKVWTKGRKA